jgi:hypothetical protein
LIRVVDNIIYVLCISIVKTIEFKTRYETFQRLRVKAAGRDVDVTNALAAVKTKVNLDRLLPGVGSMSSQPLDTTDGITRKKSFVGAAIGVGINAWSKLSSRDNSKIHVEAGNDSFVAENGEVSHDNALVDSSDRAGGSAGAYNGVMVTRIADGAKDTQKNKTVSSSQKYLKNSAQFLSVPTENGENVLWIDGEARIVTESKLLYALATYARVFGTGRGYSDGREEVRKRILMFV